LKIRVITEYYLQGEEIGMVNDRRETTTVNGMAFHAEVSAFAVGEYRQQFQIPRWGAPLQIADANRKKIYQVNPNSDLAECPNKLFGIFTLDFG
jgi:hypothetical protein